jgi:hypothetical protein
VPGAREIGVREIEGLVSKNRIGSVVAKPWRKDYRKFTTVPNRANCLLASRGTHENLYTSIFLSIFSFS